MTCAVTLCVKPTERRGWCSAHYARWKKWGDVQAEKPLRVRRDLYAQIMSKVEPDPETGHWWWVGHVNRQTGYGMVNIAKRPTTAHRAVWELLVGPIPPKLEPDHLCRTRSCVNPEHLEPVTRSENMRRAHAANRKTHCLIGHPFDEVNTIYRRQGGRTCRACKNASSRRYYHQLKDAA